jgi:phage baseplate assembly protein V
MFQLQRDDQITSGVGGREATDQARRLSNLARYGVVHEADYTGETAGFPAIRVSVQDGEILTDWLPWFSPRAGKDRVWDPPEVGEVVMLLAPSGELSNGVAIPGLFSDGNANGDRAGLHRRTYDDGTVVEYDREAHTVTVDASESDSEVIVRASRIRATASEELTIASPIIRLRTAVIGVDADDDAVLPQATVMVQSMQIEASEQISLTAPLIQLSAPTLALNPGAGG